MTAFSSETLSVILGLVLLVDIIVAVALIVIATIYIRKGRK